jgi:hypothetical protein
MLCYACKQPVEGQAYRLIGVEAGTWASLYAHRGACEENVRRRFAPPTVAKTEVQGVLVTTEPEELTMDAPAPFTDTDAPWFGLERRR